ncbi:hypothetical protein NPX13_g4290 [Xylaria arbuscula]|uniref:Phenol 2-monooxygenase n=1 Tax=Xylaria arbuscula TaxID=114810 RepID=A0A9W8TM28_9PEZI|nr:hypothetical protein NPX13_g4290 [Xylaria arbuscula]
MVQASGSTNIEYGCDVQDVSIDTSHIDDPDAHCVTVNAMKDGSTKVYKAKYALGSDGAHSHVRKSLGFTMVGDSSDEVWGVMDVYAKTDFPDIRKKVIIKSESGAMLIIPREGEFLVRLYMDLTGTVGSAKEVTLAQLHDKARKIFQPYTIEFPETVWWSAYVIGQRLANGFHAHHRVFLSGDACHTHSPKAGQGMNVSLQDGHNIGWKLAAVLKKQASPDLLKTYVLERQKTAADLIDFDRYWSKLFSTSGGEGGGITPELFVKAGRYTAGLAIRYENSMITAATDVSSLATNLTVGTRFPSARVVRVGDAKPMWLTKALPADSRWHLVVFGGDILDEDTARKLHKLALDLDNLVRTFTPFESNPDPKPKGPIGIEKQWGVPDGLFNIILVLSSKRANVEIETIPKTFTPETGKWKLKNLLNIFVEDESHNDIHKRAYEAYGIDPKKGAIVVVRPDQYIARVDPLDHAHCINSFFGGFLKKPN